MLNPRTQQIIYQSYIKVGDLSYKICCNLAKGKDYTDRQKEYYYKGIQILRILRRLLVHVRIEDNKLVLYRITDLEVNQLIACLIKLGDLDKYPIPTNITPTDRDIKVPIRKVYNA